MVDPQRHPLLLIPLLDYPYPEVAADLNGHLAKCRLSGKIAAADIRFSDLIVTALTARSVLYYNNAAAWLEQGMPLDERIVGAIEATVKDNRLPQSTRQRVFALAQRWKKAI